MEFKITELDLADNRTIEKFYDFYVNVFEKCFPKDEIGPFEAYLSIKCAENAAYSYHLDFAEVDGKYVACFIYCVFPGIKSIVGEFACVDK